eukprot:sb/3470426/
MTCDSRGGVPRSYEMLGYVLGTVCRRVSLAAYFGEHFDTKDCAGLCDRCRDNVTFQTQDITTQAREILGILDNKDKDLTYAMLLTEWKSKRKGGSKKLSPSTLELVLLQLLRENVLQEKFKAGMYKALSYCVYGGHARAVLSGARTVTLPILPSTAAQFTETAAGQPTPATKSSAPTHRVLANKGSKSCAKKRKAAIVFDSDESD